MKLLNYQYNDQKGITGMFVLLLLDRRIDVQPVEGQKEKR